MNGKKDVEWKISIKNEEELFMSKRKSGKIKKFFSGVLVFVVLICVVFFGYKIGFDKEKDTFKSYLEKNKLDEAKECYDYSTDMDILIDEILKRRLIYEKDRNNENLSNMWKLIFMFETNIRVGEKAFYSDLEAYPKERKVIRVACLQNKKEEDMLSSSSVTNVEYIQYYMENIIYEEYYKENQLYNYYLDIEIIPIDNKKNIPDDIDILYEKQKYILVNETNTYAKEIVDILNNEEEYEDAVVTYDTDE